MLMSALFTQAEIEALGAPHVARAWFVRLDLPTGVAHLHSGVGTVIIDGIEWRGVTDPIGGRAVAISGVKEPAFGQATAVTISLTGADREFLRSVHATRAQIEGRAADIYWCAYDGETQQPVTGLKGLFTRGYMSAPTLSWEGLSTRSVSITIENIWSAMNFKTGRRWNPTGQRELYPGDKGLDFVGVKVQENWQ
jgi:hypothetical protein